MEGAKRKKSKAAFIAPRKILKDNPSKSKPTRAKEPCNIKSRYYKIVWCKRSYRKHKVWSEDGFLELTENGTTTLFSLEGRKVGRSSRQAQMNYLKPDETVFVGDKEVMIVEEISKNHWMSGQCFQEEPIAPSVLAIGTRPKAFKPLRAFRTEFAPIAKPKPRFDPTAPEAFVLTRPPDHDASEVVDVVLDPFLSRVLRDNQKDGIRFMYECVMGFRRTNCFGAILADDMGFGKTLQSIGLIWALLNQGPNGKPVAKRVLVVCPGSLVKNWHKEFKKWIGAQRLDTYCVDSNHRPDDFKRFAAHRSKVMIISYEMALRYSETMNTIKFDLLICDEAHRLKNSKTKSARCLATMTNRRVCLTGTPLQNDLSELYTIAEFSNPGILGTPSAFRAVYEDPIFKGKQPGATTEETKLGEARAVRLNEIISSFVLRRTDSSHLPPRHDYVLFCRPTDFQISLYQSLMHLRAADQVLHGSAKHLVYIQELTALCNCPSLLYMKDRSNGEPSDKHSLYPYGYNPKADHSDSCGKLILLRQFLHSIRNGTEEKVVIVSNSTKALDRIQLMCTTEDFTYKRLEGSTPTATRVSIVENFNRASSAQTFVLLLSSKAGGTGLNIPGASRLFLYDSDWNPANDLQAMARIWRQGQTRQVHIYRLVTTGTIEEKIYQRQIMKQDVSGAVIDASRQGSIAGAFSMDDLKVNYIKGSEILI